MTRWSLDPPSNMMCIEVRIRCTQPPSRGLFGSLLTLSKHPRRSAELRHYSAVVLPRERRETRTCAESRGLLPLFLNRPVLGVTLADDQTGCRCPARTEYPQPVAATADIHHHHEADHLGRAVEITEGIAHRRRLRNLARWLKPIYSDNAPCRRRDPRRHRCGSRRTCPRCARPRDRRSRKVPWVRGLLSCCGLSCCSVPLSLSFCLGWLERPTVRPGDQSRRVKEGSHRGSACGNRGMPCTCAARPVTLAFRLSQNRTGGEKRHAIVCVMVAQLSLIHISEPTR